MSVTWAIRCSRLSTLMLLLIASSAALAVEDAPDIRTVPADLTVPAVSQGPPLPGRRCLVTDQDSGVALVVYLPREWNSDSIWPVIIELPGNGGYRNRYGDSCTGMPEDCSLGYGVTGGTEAIWICVPFLDSSGNQVAVTWWGDAPDYDPRPTVELLKRTVGFACSDQLHGDPDRVFLAGFSRGSIACNYIGLFDNEIAGVWCGMICCSHYDGVHEGWPYPDSGRTAAVDRLQRLGRTPQFICHESTGRSKLSLRATKHWLQETGADGVFTLRETGYRNHTDQWVLRPGAARDELRTWFRQRLSHQTE